MTLAPKPLVFLHRSMCPALGGLLMLVGGGAWASESDAPGADLQLVIGTTIRTAADARVNVGIHNTTKALVSLAEVECAALDKDGKPGEVRIQEVENIAPDQTAYLAVTFTSAISADYHYACRLAFAEHQGV